MTNITDAVLAAALKELIGSGIVRRKQFGEIPLRMEYSLTEKGRSVVPILQSICHWTGAYHRENSEAAPPGAGAVITGENRKNKKAGCF